MHALPDGDELGERGVRRRSLAKLVGDAAVLAVGAEGAVAGEVLESRRVGGVAAVDLLDADREAFGAQRVRLALGDDGLEADLALGGLRLRRVIGVDADLLELLEVRGAGLHDVDLEVSAAVGPAGTVARGRTGDEQSGCQGGDCECCGHRAHDRPLLQGGGPYTIVVTCVTSQECPDKWN